MKRAWLMFAALVLSVAASAAPRAITWVQPTLWDDGTPLLSADITGASIYLLGTGAAPTTTGAGMRWYSISGSNPLAVIDITQPTWVQVAVIAGGAESARSVAVLIAPKLRAPGAPASPAAVNPLPTVCSVPAGCPGP